MSSRFDRRWILTGGMAIAAGTAAFSGTAFARAAAVTRHPYSHVDGPRSRVVIVNDLAGDIDGLFATVHALLSPSAEVRGIIATGTDAQTNKAATQLARDMLKLMNLTGKVPVFEGAMQPMKDVHTPVASPGARAIVAEAMRTDTDLPLFICVGGGLTEVASALLLEPQIANKFTLIWIGGGAYPDGGIENNVMIDPNSTQYIFNEANVPMWQVPSTAYALCQISDTEVQMFIAPYGKIGPWLYDRIFELSQRIKTFVRNPRHPWNTGETWTLGDSPLVLLTALTAWVPSNFLSSMSSGFRYEGTGASLFREISAPRIDATGKYTTRPDGRKIRVYETIDTRLMMNDFFAKMQANYPRAG